MSRRLAWLGAIAVLALGTAWFFATFDRMPVTEHVPPTAEARVRDFLAAERFAERMGLRARELRSLPELDKLSPGILVVPNRRQSIDAVRSRQLLAWAQAGNHLIVEAGLPGVDDPLVEAVQIKPGEGTAQSKPAVPDRPQTAVYSYARGKGIVTVAPNLNFARNRLIGLPGNADLLWKVMQLTPAKALQVFFRPERLSLTGFLVQHALLALIAAAVLLALWLWHIGPRFGPIVPDPPPARRRLLDHLRASGRYYWAQGLRARLVLAARDAALRRIARSQPDFPSAPQSEKQARLAALVGIRPEEAAQWLAAGGAMRGLDFIRMVQRAQRVHRALEKGGR